MSNNFTPTRRDRQCPVCGNNSGNCRIHDKGELILCMTNADMKNQDRIEEYVCIGSDGLWGSFKLDAGTWDLEDKARHQERQKRREQQRIAEYEKEAAKSVPVEERDRLYSEYLATLSLSQEDFKELSDRGLTPEEIKAIGFKSLDKGYLIPVRGQFGIIGCQIRMRNVDKNKYRWLSNKDWQPHIYINGCRELPISCYDDGRKSKVLAICEGVGSKPYLAMERLGMPVIGVAGGQLLASLEQVKDYLKMFYPETVVLIPDAGDVKNEHVLTRLQRQSAWLRSLGLKVQFAWWGQVEKSANDIDELANNEVIEMIDSDALASLRASELPSPDLDTTNEPDETTEEINQILELQELRLPDKAFLPEDLEKAIALHCNLKNLRRETFLTSLLTGLSSLMNPRTKLRMAWQFTVSPVLYTAIVSESSQGKSPILKAIASDTLTAMQIKGGEDFKMRMETYEDAHEAWVKSKGSKADEPKKPERRLYYVTDITSEACDRQSSRQPDHGFLILSDELKGYFNSQGQYKNGNGSDAEKMLERYDGTANVTVRVDGGIVAEGYNSLVSILGGVQPKVLTDMMKTGDEAGKWARFMFVYQPLAEMDILLEPTEEYLRADEVLSQVYHRFAAYCEHENFYRLTPEAGIYFKKARARLEQLRVKNGGAIGNAYGKAAGRIGKLALMLHCLHYSWRQECPPTEIDITYVKMAVQLVNFYHRQFQYFMQPQEELTSQMVSIINLATRRKGEWISARDCGKSDRSIRSLPSHQTQLMFEQLAKIGKGETKTTGHGTKFRIGN